MLIFCFPTAEYINIVIPDDFTILIPFDSLLVCGKHWVRLFGLFEKAAFAASLALHHQVVMFGFHRSWLIQIVIHITLITRVHIHPASTSNIH